MNGRKCDICAGERFSPFETIQYRGMDINYLICDVCGLVFQHPSPSYQEIVFRVNAKRWTHDERRRDYWIDYIRAERMKKMLAQNVPPPRSILDVGCRYGHLMSTLGPGAKTTRVGLEENANLRNIAQKYAVGNQVYPNLGYIKGGFFDLITITHNLELLKKPSVTLYTLRRFTAPDGKLVVETPNFLVHPSLRRDSLYAFTAETLTNMLAVTGWEVIWLKRHGHPDHTKLDLYLTALCRPAERIARRLVLPPGEIKKKRRFGQLKRLFAMTIYGGGTDVDTTGGYMV